MTRDMWLWSRRAWPWFCGWWMLWAVCMVPLLIGG